MKKEDLKVGNILETRCGEKILVCHTGEWINFKGIKIFEGGYLKDLIYLNANAINNVHDIMKVYEDYTLKKVLWERKEFVVSTDEKTILRILPKQFKWIVRSYENILFLYEDKPQKTRYYWQSSLGDVENLMVFNHLFEYIKWEDELPTLIEDLLKE